MQFFPGKSTEYNAGWESFFIDRELADNPYPIDTAAYRDWIDGYKAASSSSKSCHPS